MQDARVHRKWLIIALLASSVVGPYQSKHTKQIACNLSRINFNITVSFNHHKCIQRKRQQRLHITIKTPIKNFKRMGLTVMVVKCTKQITCCKERVVHMCWRIIVMIMMMIVMIIITVGEKSEVSQRGEVLLAVNNVTVILAMKYLLMRNDMM